MTVFGVLAVLIAAVVVQGKKEKQLHTKDVPICGEGYKGLLNHQFNRDDSDALITTAAFLSKNALNLFTGNISYMKIDLALSILPLETLNNKCFSIRNEDALPNILCAGGLLERNEWINAIESSMLCASTGVKSRLPLIPGEEILEEVEEDSPKGINLFIHDGPNGRPEIYINGKTTTQLEKEREELAMADSSVEPIADMSHLFHNLQAEDGPVTPAPLDQEAMDEAKVEAGLVSPNIPEKGYFHLHHHEI
ncbi:signal peptide-containing protein [Theileria equi strain WA]|uniref:Signal peptide-containing protein n=1 Tax=Theileria equi strain WA TaxID=1537102 RepID=L0B094_THEEQ|nr:signal peptide-containing protein [Theileria equi strain WA]AFZ80898.1 signal peptide-containing protein [Theileria equi strain WA]|eukprot:XP_004830564.1 signal peptide-containing protein [Theileria equi strain WA]